MAYIASPRTPTPTPERLVLSALTYIQRFVSGENRSTVLKREYPSEPPTAKRQPPRLPVPSCCLGTLSDAAGCQILL